MARAMISLTRMGLPVDRSPGARGRLRTRGIPCGPSPPMILSSWIRHFTARLTLLAWPFLRRAESIP
ncbi:MAG: hypothetical protein NTZ78_03490 [Candidatus Aureabacteria bacterium]|nr:hypothetical protein [Candidatus Auribacterota bacterium]